MILVRSIFQEYDMKVRIIEATGGETLIGENEMRWREYEKKLYKTPETWRQGDGVEVAEASKNVSFTALVNPKISKIYDKVCSIKNAVMNAKDPGTWFLDSVQAA